MPQKILTFLKKYKFKLIAFLFITAVLCFSFWWGGNSPSLHGWNVNELNSENIDLPQSENVKTDEISENENALPDTDETIQNGNENFALAKIAVTDKAQNSNAKKDINQADDESVTSDTSDTFDTSDNTVNEKENTAQSAAQNDENTIYTAPSVSDEKKRCTISISCASILNHMDYLAKEKHSLVPADGIILHETEAYFYEGESVFEVLRRETRRAKIHMEFSSTPLYDSYYIEGINNIYEFDCKEGSGWMYSVNGVFPNYGCNNYILHENDKIEWLYTCDLGNDIGAKYSR